MKSVIEIDNCLYIIILLLTFKMNVNFKILIIIRFLHQFQITFNKCSFPSPYLFIYGKLEKILHISFFKKNNHLKLEIISFILCLTSWAALHCFGICYYFLYVYSAILYHKKTVYSVVILCLLLLRVYRISRRNI